MEWIQRLNQAVNYIEENLSGTIDYSTAAKIACCSTFHFQRMFSYIADIPLSEYIRRRRMTAAAFELQTTAARVVDIALKYGYQSPTAFTRAFQSVHSVPPSSARSKGISLKAYPRITFSISIKGDTEMNYKIIEKQAFRIVGVCKSLDVNFEESYKKVPALWQEAAKKNLIPQLVPLMDKEPLGVLGVSSSMNEKTFDYYIAVATDKSLPQGMTEFTIPAATWAVFECIGPLPQAIQTLQRRIVTEWLPNSGYEYASAPDIEVYGEGDQQAEDYRCEVWLPVSKK